ncbi:PqqD family protein [Streptomyces sp. A3M-1-3]|uniref:PqqD family protein n=1 Tax=Streptomyces sp. A3M-1-3 TaxID=2962044 RepID=UPI0020B83158|nr:PqqD family protein [Streptomyces sp. A3M-1-3]MCP3819491.1 PqqD family protein [Streptomyces sp. A3M-1-3]
MKTVRLYPLARRPDGDEWIVGRVDTGDFVALPWTGARAVELLDKRMSPDDVARQLRAETGEDVDVVQFVEELTALGYVAEIDGCPVASPKPRRVTWPWLRPHHIRWVLSPLTALSLLALVAAAVGVLVRDPGLFPGYRALLWSPHGSLVIGFGAAVGWALILLHEAAHLVTARAAGVPAGISLGTRLQFLVAQTDMSGIELAPRRHRLTAYLAGIAVNLGVASSALLGLAATPPGGTPHRMLAAIVLLALLPLPFQCMVFMRTDVYFVLQDLTGCRDLYGDGTEYACYTARRLRCVFLRGRPAPADPSLRLPAPERRAVRLYSAVLVVGTALCLTVLAVVTLPADLALLARAAGRLAPGHSWTERLEAAAVLAALGGIQVLWAVTWYRRRRGRRKDRVRRQV